MSNRRRNFCIFALLKQSDHETSYTHIQLCCVPRRRAQCRGARNYRACTQGKREQLRSLQCFPCRSRLAPERRNHCGGFQSGERQLRHHAVCRAQCPTPCRMLLSDSCADRTCHCRRDRGAISGPAHPPMRSMPSGDTRNRTQIWAKGEDFALWCEGNVGV